MMEPFRKPFDIHISSFMTREKSGPQPRRNIIVLSRPKGFSVNDGCKNLYLGTEFQLHYPSVDTIIHQLIKLGPAARLL